MVPAPKLRLSVPDKPLRGKNVLPLPRLGEIWILSGKRIGEGRMSLPTLEFSLVKQLETLHLVCQFFLHHLRKHGHAVFESFAVTDENLICAEIDIFDAQACA